MICLEPPLSCYLLVGDSRDAGQQEMALGSHFGEEGTHTLTRTRAQARMPPNSPLRPGTCKVHSPI